MARNIGKIHRTRRGWRVNRMYFRSGRDTEVHWTSRPGRDYVIALLPSAGRPGRGVIVIPSSRGKASFRLSKLHPKRDTVLPYMILLKDGVRFNYVIGNSPPIIIIQ